MVVGLVFLLVVTSPFQRLQDPGVYNDAIADTGAYTRVYDEVLVDDSLREQTANLTGDVNIAVHDELVDVLREVMPRTTCRTRPRTT